MMRWFVIVAAALTLQGCWFVFIPGSAFGGGGYCVNPNAKVGDKIKLDDGRIATVKAIQGPASSCSTKYPLKADLEF